MVYKDVCLTLKYHNVTRINFAFRFNNFKHINKQVTSQGLFEACIVAGLRRKFGFSGQQSTLR
ncbi:hypothetical protein LR48_Vigan2302s000100 [Vigna angularis]|nr:hypothetical protein LR48_Vigan2302s000100 [Vigna angularis]